MLTTDAIVAFEREFVGEPIFQHAGTRWQYCWCIYAGGRVDVGVYSFAGDVCYSYSAFQEMLRTGR